MNANINNPLPTHPSDQEGWVPESVSTAPVDADGNPIPEIWQHSKRWATLPAHLRQKWSRIWVEAEIENERQRRMHKPKAKRGPAPPFTTQYCVDWGNKQKSPSGIFHWKLIDREKFERSMREGVRDRHRDLMLGLDVLFDDGKPGMIGFQAGTPGEEKEHYQRFLDRGGPETAKRRGIRVFWIEFVRGDKNPKRIAQWA